MRRIPNLIIFAGILGAVFLFYDCFSISFLYQKIIAIIIPFVCFYGLYKIGALGAGDVKLYCLLGFYLTFQDLFKVILSSLIIAALNSLIKMIYQKNLASRIRYFYSYLIKCSSNQKIYPYYLNQNRTKETTVTLALPVLVSSVIVIWGKNI